MKLTTKLVTILSGAGVADPFSDNFIRDDGPIDGGWIGSGATISSDKLVITPALGDNLLANPGAEGTYVDGLAPSWHRQTSGGTPTESADAHTGLAAQSLQVTAAQTEITGSPPVAVTIGNWYMVSLWGKIAAGTSSAWRARTTDSTTIVSGTITGTGYRQYHAKFKAAKNTAGVYSNCPGATLGAHILLLDDLFLGSLSYPSMFCLRQYKEADVIVNSAINYGLYDTCGLVVNADDPYNPQNYILAKHIHGSTNIILSKIIAGVETVLQTINVVYVDSGEMIEIRKLGTTYQVWYRGRQASTDHTITEFTNNRFHGMYSEMGTSSFVSFSARKYGVEYPVSDLSSLFVGATYPTGNGVLSLRFDDDTLSAYTVVYPLLAARSFPAGFAISRDTYGLQLLCAHILEMQTGGMEIMNHSRTHGVDPANDAAFEDETVTAAAEQRLLGYNIASFVQPGTWTGTYYFNSVAMYGTPAELLLRKYFKAYEAYILSFDSANGYNMPRVAGSQWGQSHLAGGEMTLVQLSAWVDGLIAGHLGSEVLFHAGLIDAGGANISLADFTTWLDYVASKVTAGTLTVLTPTQQLFATPI